MFTIGTVIIVVMRAWLVALFLKIFNGLGEHNLKKVARFMRLSVATYCFAAVLSFFVAFYFGQLAIWLFGIFWSIVVFGLFLWYASTWVNLGKELKRKNISL